MANVLGLGTAAMDVIMQCENLPSGDGFAFIHNEMLLPGGSCANVMHALLNLGVKGSMIAQVGDDSYGNLFIEDMKASGVDTKYMKMKKGGTSLHTFIGVGKNGEKVIYSNLGDSLLELSEEDVGEHMLEGVDVFYTDMFPGKPALKLAKICKKEGISVVFNLQCPVDFMNLCNVSTDEIEEMLSIADIVFLCPEGLESILKGKDEENLLEAAYERYVPSNGMISTRGANGALWVGKDGCYEAKAVSVEASDTTGAGDAFNAGIIYALYIQKMDIKKAMNFASACAGLKCTQLGPRMKGTVDDVQKIMLGC